MIRHEARAHGRQRDRVARLFLAIRRRNDPAEASFGIARDPCGAIERGAEDHARERFAIAIPNRVATRLTTVGDAVRFIEAKVTAR